MNINTSPNTLETFKLRTIKNNERHFFQSKHVASATVNAEKNVSRKYEANFTEVNGLHV